MKPKVQQTVTLSPDVVYDEKTTMYSARFAEFPQLIAYDDSEEKAVTRLLTIFQVMIDNRPREVVQILKKITAENEPQISELNSKIVEMNGRGNQKRQLQIAM